MRTIIIIMSFLVLFIDPAKGQDYDSVVTNSKQWRVLSGGYCCPEFPLGSQECCYQTSFIKFSDDTLIESNIFKKVIRSVDSLKTFQTVGYIRESDKRVYFANLKFMTGLIYDFNIRLEDTVAVVIDNYSLGGEHDTIFYNSTYIVTKVDTYEYAFKKRIRITLKDINHNTKEQWIEGIGSINGILTSGYSSAGFVGGFVELLCVLQSNNQIYFDTNRKSCYYSYNTGISNIKSNNDFTIYPNPAEKIVTIKGLSITSNSSFTMYDLTGQIIYTKYINSNLIQLPNLKSNIYFYRIVTLNNQIIGKLIVK